MLPNKHYAASEIEEVIKREEDPTAPLPDCGAEESTLRRWKREFPEILTTLTSHLNLLSNATVSLLSMMRPLQRLYDAVKALNYSPPAGSYLAWAYFVSETNPVHIE
jgi:hypothetical protein